MHSKGGKSSAFIPALELLNSSITLFSDAVSSICFDASSSLRPFSKFGKPFSNCLTRCYLECFTFGEPSCASNRVNGNAALIIGWNAQCSLRNVLACNTICIENALRFRLYDNRREGLKILLNSSSLCTEQVFYCASGDQDKGTRIEETQ